MWVKTDQPGSRTQNLQLFLNTPETDALTIRPVGRYNQGHANTVYRLLGCVQVLHLAEDQDASSSTSSSASTGHIIDSHRGDHIHSLSHPIILYLVFQIEIRTSEADPEFFVSTNLNVVREVHSRGQLGARSQGRTPVGCLWLQGVPR